LGSTGPLAIRAPSPRPNPRRFSTITVLRVVATSYCHSSRFSGLGHAGSPNFGLFCAC
jgi:hypothetical protein